MYFACAKSRGSKVSESPSRGLLMPSTRETREIVEAARDEFLAIRSAAFVNNYLKHAERSKGRLHTFVESSINADELARFLVSARYLTISFNHTSGKASKIWAPNLTGNRLKGSRPDPAPLGEKCQTGLGWLPDQ